MPKVARAVALAAIMIGGAAARADTAERLCDTSVEDCRAPLLQLIRAETIGIDVGFWFMEDDRYATELIRKWQAGVPIRVITDTDSLAIYPDSVPILRKLTDAGIPIRVRSGNGIVHWKMMLFAGLNVVEFSSANFSSHAFVPVVPYQNYIDEVIYFSDDPAVVNSFKTKFDDVWTAMPGFSNYANVTEPLVRHYPTFPLDPAMNFPPFQSFQSRSISRYNEEKVGIDAIMFRILDRKHIDALIAAHQRGVQVRLITEPDQYRDPTRLWHSWNVDRAFVAGIPVRHRKHAGHTHEKATVLHGQEMTIFGSANWTTQSSTLHLEHNYFTTKPFFYDFFRDNFERKWNNGAGFEETQPFVPLPPDAPVPQAPSNTAQNQATTVTLKWYGGPWAHAYDVYVGIDPASLAPAAANLDLGPSDKPTRFQSYTLTGLQSSTTYYWKIVGRTAANLAKTGPVWSFRTQGAAAAAGPRDPVLYAAKATVVVGNWSVVADVSAAGGARLANANLGAAKLSSPLESPAHYFEMTFDAEAGVPYRLWVRGKAASNSWANDSAFVQFSTSVTAGAAPTYRIGTGSAATYSLEECGGCGVSNWGWNDNGYGAGVLGDLIRFATSGEQRIRIQVREDGLSIDQIVLSRDVFLNTAPGAPKDDGTILLENGGSGAPPAQAATIVLHTAAASRVGAWALVDDATAASGRAVVLPDAGRAKVVVAVSNPADYFELTFVARANTPYRLWMRGRALGNSSVNDSVHVQFTDSVDAAGQPFARIGSASSHEVNLEDCGKCGNSGWGWEDNGWGAETTLGPEIRFATDGVKTIRVQNREDGFYIDQIVLSPQEYLTLAPGANKDDSTILNPT